VGETQEGGTILRMSDLGRLTDAERIQKFTPEILRDLMEMLGERPLPKDVIGIALLIEAAHDRRVQMKERSWI
jgi:hypothetical protein